VETLFNVSVVNLQVMLVKGKTKRGAGGRVRRRSDWKKAYIRLEAGHEIDFANIT
jgi:large subunit ribosomal protein L23